ncbi:MAG: hypothetical protein K6E99_03965, partial [Bacilli bacterium]|nr:hypothetical protein [Bacilli bacterium]
TFKYTVTSNEKDGFDPFEKEFEIVYEKNDDKIIIPETLIKIYDGQNLPVEIKANSLFEVVINGDTENKILSTSNTLSLDNFVKPGTYEVQVKTYGNEYYNETSTLFVVEIELAELEFTVTEGETLVENYSTLPFGTHTLEVKASKKFKVEFTDGKEDIEATLVEDTYVVTLSDVSADIDFKVVSLDECYSVDANKEDVSILVQSTQVTEQTVTYTFTNKSWTDATNSWASVTAGSSFEQDRGVATSKKTLEAISKNEFKNVKKVILNASTNSSGTFFVKVGETIVSKDLGKENHKFLEFDFDNLSGQISIGVSKSIKSSWIKSVTVIYEG